MLEYRSYWRVHRPSAWSKAPTEMTVSALRDIEACPRRWALNAATYDGLWQGRGYPPRLRLGSLSGSVIHLALETVLDALATSSCGSITDPAAVNVLKSLGGYTKVLNDCITRVLSAFSGNPRAVRLLEAGDRSLRSQLPKLRTATQTLVGRVRLSARARPTGFATSERPPTSLPEGTHLELVLRAPNMGWKGKADLLTCSRYSCEIVDFKTGVADDSHRFQLQVYAVLWSRDQNLNPNGRLATKLTLAYPTGDVDVAVPSPPAFAALERDLFARAEAARRAVTSDSPEARPSLDNCGFCGVKQLCEDYWTADNQRQLAGGRALEKGSYRDVELTITGQHGPHSWDAILELDSGPPRRVLLRSSSGDLDLHPGERARILDVQIATILEDQNDPLILTIGSFSEVYELASA
ncbi:MAG: PD-(D/E)XK nuclease family protein [Vicinamibacterales bacterium]